MSRSVLRTRLTVVSTDNLRASDQDRDRTAEIVRQAATEGRLDLEEMDQRLEQVFAAKTYGELVRVTADLPNAKSEESVAASGRASSGPAVTGPTELTAVFGTEQQSGAWLVPPRMRVRAVVGEVKLDFTDATIPHEVWIEAQALFGQVTLYVPDDVAVVFDAGSAFMASRENKTTAEPRPGTPVIRVSGSLALSELVARPPKRKFLRRRR